MDATRRFEVTPEEQARFRRLAAKAEAEGKTVSGRLSNGSWTFFLVPKDATDEDVADHAFALREKRPITEGERVLRRMAQQRALEAPIP